jgi:hypothetical protein
VVPIVRVTLDPGPRPACRASDFAFVTSWTHAAQPFVSAPGIAGGTMEFAGAYIPW